MPVAAPVASRMAEALCSRELPLSMELAAELERLLGCHDEPDAAAILHAEVIGALRRLHVRFRSIVTCAKHPQSVICDAEFAESEFKAIGARAERLEARDVIREVRALFPAEWNGEHAHVG